jgi:hypothetical protein
MKQQKRPWINKYDTKLIHGMYLSRVVLAFLALSAPIFVGLATAFPITQTAGWQVLQTVCMAVLGLGLLVSMIYLGIRSIGYAAGFDSFIQQARHVLWRLFLYVFLPAGLITLALVVYAVYGRA